MVVDDEPFARDLIEGYINQTPFLELAASFSNPFKALAYLTEKPVDLLFLDINMPELSGMQLLKSLPAAPRVVFTTAYSEFAAESYELNAVDYLIKPVKYERFLKAVNKAVELAGHLQKGDEKEGQGESRSKDSVLLKSGTRINRIRTSDILYVEGAGNYMIFVTGEQRIMTLLNMGEVLQLLPSDRFIKVHKSYVVNMDRVDVIEKHQLIIHKQKIPVGVTYREQVFLKLGQPG
jgi:DNA-binding LytR/AlgR family response regulator